MFDTFCIVASDDVQYGYITGFAIINMGTIFFISLLLKKRIESIEMRDIKRKTSCVHNEKMYNIYKNREMWKYFK